MDLLLIAVILFAAAALGGVLMAHMRMSEKQPPMGLALVHGGAAATGLALVLWTVLQGARSGLLPIALGCFVVAALGGFFLFSFHLRGKVFPKPVMFLHAIVAVAGFGLLCAVRFAGK